MPVCSAKVRYEQFLERLINNNEPEYFYLHQEPTADFPEPCCAFLALSIPVKADLHYQKCVDARILSLQETFKAKLGWLVGQMYSRVGTQDWERSALKEKVSELIDQAALWLDTKQIKELQRAVNEWRAANPTTEITPKLVLELSEQLPTRKQKALSRIEAIVKGGGKGVPELTPEQIKSLLRHLSNDQGLTEVLR
ncbi:MAG: hypothetical protein CVV05_12700 [Gammaproteobacteria bacterium HGW-Gammaproteobacteria-1]|nr:MAG: hypothetical protein CVV05_12700 [Gammaproteobacteria bacterium HGW-Gammaproteobacteria-1]